MTQWDNKRIVVTLQIPPISHFRYTPHQLIEGGGTVTSHHDKRQTLLSCADPEPHKKQFPDVKRVPE